GCIPGIANVVPRACVDAWEQSERGNLDAARTAQHLVDAAMGLLDMATLAVRLDKPLSARLFPVPGTRAGDAVSWDTPYFSPSVAMGTLEATATGVLGSATRHVARLDPFRPG
ncbi:MAG: DUF711 family protein, partial [Proteobacteria bacterium]|nr:DUF711 family protein [Pseudomonadota bacterium]